MHQIDLTAQRALARTLDQHFAKSLPPEHYKEWELLLRIAESGVQDTRLVALRRASLRIARAVINPEGKWEPARAQEALKHWSSWVPQWPFLLDGIEEVVDQMEWVLTLLLRERTFGTLLHSCTRPLGQPFAEARIRASLQMQHDQRLEHRDVRVACLAALLCPLRQSVGSCFATAPALLLQRENPMAVLEDLRSLIDTAKIERVTAGKVAAVPMAARWAGGLVRRPLTVSLESAWGCPALQGSLQQAGLHDGSSEAVLRLLQRAQELLGGGPFRPVDLFERLVADHLQLEWPLPSLELKGSDLLLTAAEAKALRLHDRWTQGVQRGVEAFASWEHDPLLKTWEYTVASFVEARPALLPQNLHTALGLSDPSPDAIGGALIVQLQQALDETQEEMEVAQELAAQAVARVRGVQGRVGQIQDSRAAEWALMEARSAQRDYEYAEGRVAHLQERAEQLAHFPELFARIVQGLLPRYFQEAYDPALTSTSESLYDDAPAGFRLIYKGGVEHVPSWIWVETEGQYRDAMREFLERVFHDLRDEPDIQWMGAELHALSRDFSLTLDRPEFLEGSLRRLAQLHGNSLPDHPLQEMEKVKALPWAYESGGTLLTLVDHYYGLDGLPQREEKNCERPIDLAVFYLEQLRVIPDAAQHTLKQPHAGVLAYSPTHAFVLNTARPCLQEAMHGTQYLYSWLQECCLAAGTQFLSQPIVTGEASDVLFLDWLSLLPGQAQAVAQLGWLGLPDTCTPAELLKQVAHALPQDVQRKGLGAALCQRLEVALRRSLPLLTKTEALQRMTALFPWLQGTEAESDLLCLGYGRLQWMHAQAALQGQAISRTECVQTLRDAGLLPPPPFLFADTNWPFYSFALVPSMVHEEAELWRCDPLGVTGFPMQEWLPYLSLGNEKPWGLLQHPNEYRGRMGAAWAQLQGRRMRA